MRLRTFHAATMKQAMEQIRDEIGEEAVIVSTNRNTGGKGVSVMVAQNDAEEEHHTLHEQIAEENTHAAHFAAMPDFVIKELENQLIAQAVDPSLISTLLKEARELPFTEGDIEKGINDTLAEALRRMFQFDGINVNATGLRLIFIGAPGAGKTLTTAKIASRMVKAGQKPVVITTDFKRAGGAEQLSALTDIMGIDLKVACSRAELRALLSQCTPTDTVLIDSAGANPYDFQELKEIGEFAGLMELEPVLVFASGGDAADAAEIARAFSFLGVKKMLITRSDLAKRFGSILNAADGAQLSLSHITGTEKVLGDFTPITPDSLALRITGKNT